MGVREDILALYPDMSSDASLDGKIAFASKQVAAWLPNRDVGVTYLTLHLMGVTKAPMGAGGGILSAKAGGVSRSFGSGGTGKGLHSSTMWGREFDNWVDSAVCGIPPKVPGYILY